MKQCKQKSFKKYHPKRKVQTKRGFEKSISANKKVSKVPTKNSATPKMRSEIKVVKNNQQKEDSRRKMQEYNSNIVNH